MDELALIFISAAIVIAFSVIYMLVIMQKKRKQTDDYSDETKSIEIKSVDESIMTMRSPSDMMRFVEEIEISNHSGQKLILSSVDSKAAHSTKKYQEITARGSAIGANLAQGAMPVLAQAQTLAQITEAAPNGLFAATAPLSELMKYKDGTVGSIVMKGGKISSHSGFQEIALTVTNPAAVIGAGMQAMAMISGQYYMDKISKQLDGIERGIERLVNFHHDEKAGKLRGIENRMREILKKKHVDDADIIALQSGMRDAEDVLMEYSTRLERIRKTGKITEIQVRKLRTRLSAAKELKKLRGNTEEYELYYSFQICLFASKLMLESKKVEFATRMKMGETEKAMEVLDSFNETYQQSFVHNAPSFLDALYNPINTKAKSLIQRQWVKSKKSTDVLRSLELNKVDLQEHISFIVEGDSASEMTHRFKADSEILYLPASGESEQRMFISVSEDF